MQGTSVLKEPAWGQRRGNSVVWGIAVATGILCALGASTVRGEDWPNWRGPDHNGISRETGWDANKLKDGPHFLWRKQIGTGFASVTVSDGRAYALGNSAKPDGKSDQEQKDTLWCFDAGTGTEIWKHTLSVPSGAQEP